MAITGDIQTIDIKNITESNKKYQYREKQYIFYFFTYFRPKDDFVELTIDGDQWGRYDIISKYQYGTDSLYWVLEILDIKENFWDMKYGYTIFIPTRSDVLGYIDFIDRFIYKDS